MKPPIKVSNNKVCKEDKERDKEEKTIRVIRIQCVRHQQGDVFRNLQDNKKKGVGKKET